MCARLLLYISFSSCIFCYSSFIVFFFDFFLFSFSLSVTTSLIGLPFRFFSSVAVALAVAGDGVMMMVTMMRILDDSYLYFSFELCNYNNYKTMYTTKNHVIFCFICIRFLFNGWNHLMIRTMVIVSIYPAQLSCVRSTLFSNSVCSFSLLSFSFCNIDV